MEKKGVDLLSKMFRDKDPSTLRAILLIGNEKELPGFLSEIEKLLSPLKKKPRVQGIPLSSWKDKRGSQKFHDLLANASLCLILCEKNLENLREEILSRGLPFLCLHGFLGENPGLSDPQYKTKNELLEGFRNLLLQESESLALLGNYSRNLFVKERKESPTFEKPSFFHLINPVPENLKSDLFIASPLVFSSLKTAREFKSGTYHVKQAYCVLPGERVSVPGDFFRTSDLKRTVLDLKDFERKRPLPLLCDILQKAYESSKSGDYLIYTNADILLLPHFYARVSELIQEGYDGIVINRRTLSKKWAFEKEIHGLYSELGSSHPGFDCFVFPRDKLPLYDLGEACVGVHLAGRSLFYNLLAHSEKFTVLKEEHLTCHIGDDNSSKNKEQLDYIIHNTESCLDVLETLEKKKKLYSQIKGNKWEETYGKNILKFNFAPGKFLEKRYSGDSIHQKNSLEKPLMIHSKDQKSASFLLKNLSLSKQKMQIKRSLKRNLLPFSKELKDYHEELESHLANLKKDSFFELQKKNEGVVKTLENFSPRLISFTEEYKSNSFGENPGQFYYSFDCHPTNLFSQKDLKSFRNKIKEITPKEGVKTIIHLTYEKDFLPLLRESFPEYHHISLHENDAADLCLEPSKLENDPFYQMRVAFKLLCLNKTVEFS